MDLSDLTRNNLTDSSRSLLHPTEASLWSILSEESHSAHITTLWSENRSKQRCDGFSQCWSPAHSPPNTMQNELSSGCFHLHPPCLSRLFMLSAKGPYTDWLSVRETGDHVTWAVTSKAASWLPPGASVSSSEHKVGVDNDQQNGAWLRSLCFCVTYCCYPCHFNVEFSSLKTPVGWITRFLDRSTGVLQVLSTRQKGRRGANILSS